MPWVRFSPFGAARRPRDGPALARPIVRSPVQRRLAILAVLLVAAIAGADWLIILMQRDASIDNFRIAATNLASGMVAQTASPLGAVDQALRDIRAALTSVSDPTPDRIQAGLRSASVFDLLVRRRERLPGMEPLVVVAADGIVASTTPAGPPAGQDLSGQDAFRHFSAADDPGAFIGAPQQDRATGQWSSVLARRIDGPNGQFAGVVLAEISLSGLQDFYRLAVPPHRMITLLRADGIVLVRHPSLADVIGWKLPDGSPWYAAAAAGGGSYLAAQPFDHVPALSVVRPLRGLPLVVVVSVSEAEVLAGWYRQRLWLMLGGTFVGLGVLLLIRLFSVQISRLGRRNAQLDIARGQLDAAMSNIPQGLCFFDGRERLIVCNRRFGELYGLPPAGMEPGVTVQEIVDYWYAAVGPADIDRDEFMMSRAVLRRAGRPHHAMIRLRDGRTIAIHQQPMPDGGWVATHEDITERRRAEEQIAFLARHDALTGLPNRSLLMERIEQARISAGRGSSFALLFLDLDRFKVVNDTLGHAAGDALLRAVTTRLLATLREGDMVARLGGDEFVVLQARPQPPHSPEGLADRIIRTVSAPYVIGDNEVVIGVSVGIDIGAGDHADAAEILKNADLALYSAKNAGRGTFRFFEAEMNTRVHQRHDLERDLQHAIDRGEFELHYQPIVNARSGLVSGFEAMLRWNHPARGLLPPGEFMAVAEDSRLIIPIGEWVLGQACHAAATWPPGIDVSINLSPVQFRAANLFDVVCEALMNAGLDSRRLHLEITETVLLQSNERNLAVMHRLHAHGLPIVMDDFGIGYSSLSYLRQFPFDRIKIDHSFISELTTRADAVYVVRAIVNLCRDLNIRTTAEGVETAEQLAILLAEGCTELQGYLFGRPLPASRLAGLLGSGPLIAPGARGQPRSGSAESLIRITH